MKILIIRFSSIGDVVLTTPIIRCLKIQLKNAEIHFITKYRFKDVLLNNPYVDRLWGIESKTDEVIDDLKSQQYDLVIDLHKNIRSQQIKKALKVKSYTFSKLNIEKWLLVNFKINKLPPIHIVERYFKTIESIGVFSDGKGLDYFISESEKVDIQSLPIFIQNGYYCLVAGGSYYTKQIPVNKLEEIVNLSPLPMVILGGNEDKMIGDLLATKFPNKVFNACGNFSINQSASLIEQSLKVITSDTGLMHIAAAFNKPIISIWGNTIPEFGMSPYLPNVANKIIEVENLSCRPCSKLGYKKCPKGHFICMNSIDLKNIF